MATQPNTWRLTIAHPDGHPLFTVLVEQASEGDGVPRPVASGPQPAAPSRASAASLPTDGEARMTDPQKRYLFRLLAAQGIEGKHAEDHLKQLFQVKALREISKAAASRLIDQMVTDQKETRDGAA